MSLNGGSLYLTNATGTNLSFNNATTISASTANHQRRDGAANTAGDTFTLGALTIGGPATPTITIAGGANVNSGTASVTFGAVTLSNSPTFNITNPTAGGVTLLTLGSITNGAGTITLTGNGNFVQTGALGGGAGGLTIGPSFTGTATLNQTNAYTGATTLNSGTLVARDNLAGCSEPAVSTLTLAGGVLKLSTSTNGSQNFGRNTTVSGNVQITSDVDNSGTAATFTFGTLAIAGQTLTIAGGTNVTNGTAGVTFGNVTLSGSPTFTVNNPTGGGSTLLTLGAISGAGNNLLVNGAGNVNVSGAITTGAGTVTMSGTGTWTMSGANTYTGVTTVNSGTLKANVASVAGVSGAFGNNSAVVMGASGGTLDISSANTQIGSLTGGGATGGVSLGSNTLSIGGDNTSPAAYSGVISGNSGAGNVTKIGTGTLILTGANTFGGTLTIANGTLSEATVNNASANGPLGNSNNGVQMGSSGLTGTFEYTGNTASTTKTFTPVTSATGVFQIDNAGQTLTLSNPLGGTNSSVTINKTGPGTLDLAGGGSSFAGTVNVNVPECCNSAPRIPITILIAVFSATSNLGMSFSTSTTTAQFSSSSAGHRAILIKQFSASMSSGTGSGNPQYTWTINAGGSMTSSGGFINMIGGFALDLNGGTLTTNNGADANNQSYYLKTAVNVTGTVASSISAGGNDE